MSTSCSPWYLPSHLYVCCLPIWLTVLPWTEAAGFCFLSTLFKDAVTCFDYIALVLNGWMDGWMDEYGVLVEWYWQENSEVLGENPVRVLLWPPHSLHVLVWDWTCASAARDWQVTTWTVVEPAGFSPALLPAYQTTPCLIPEGYSLFSLSSKCAMLVQVCCCSQWIKFCIIVCYVLSLVIFVVLLCFLCNCMVVFHL